MITATASAGNPSYVCKMFRCVLTNFHLPLASDVHAVVFDNDPLCRRVVEEGLSYRFHASWPFVLQVLGSFYRAAGKMAHPIMLKVQ